MSDTKPTVGRLVHYWPIPSECRPGYGGPLAAVIVAVEADAVALQIFNHYGPGGFYMRACRAGGAREPGSWSWPERV